MRTEIFIVNALDPVVIREPLQATIMNISGAFQNGIMFLTSHDLDGNQIAIEIHKISHLREIDD